MKRLRLLLKNTAVRLSALFILLFALCALVLVFYVTAMSDSLLRQQMRAAVAQESAEIRDIFETMGMNPLLQSLEKRARQPGANLYVIAGPTGEILAGNVASLSPGVLDEEGWKDESFEYKLFSDVKGSVRHKAVAETVFLSNGLRILIGRDLGEPENFSGLVRQALVLALAIMGIGAVLIWFLIGRNALKRMDRMSHASQRIMDGDLGQRLPISGSGDEFDRLSESLNAMLGRIEKLNEGLRQVSDNIAHDLKTPLTRIRNKAAEALDGPEEAEPYRAALTGVISESDQLIRTFSALLMISRVEAGSDTAEMSEVDLSAIVSDAAELYEPVAEDAGLVMTSEVAPGISVHGNRELIGQAIFNLVDNAIKYGTGGADNRISLTLSSDKGQPRVVVADHGPGIPQEKRQDVVKRFVRLDESRSKPGTGLGLSLVEAVMELHHGSLELSDTVEAEDSGRGLTASLLFPRIETA